ncbi:MAG: hypothetical protein AAF542_23170 [Pseudomonadota bacterium]
MTKSDNSARFVLVILAGAWLANLIPLLVISIQNPTILAEKGVFLALGVSIAGAIGAVGSVFFKTWGVWIYLTNSAIVIANALIQYFATSDAEFPWGIIAITMLFIGTVIHFKDKFYGR